MTSLSCRIYLTSNLLVGACFLYLGMPLSTDAIGICIAILAFSFVFSIPAGFALYYCFALVTAIRTNLWLKWVAFIVLLFLVSFIPYLFASGFLSGSLVSRELEFVLYISEGTAFGATLLHIIPIHRLLKNTAHENQ